MDSYCCTYCQNNIENCRIICHKCKQYFLCVQCFACGVEDKEHKKHHDYQVVDDHGQCSLFSSKLNWTLTEEESLLEAIEQHGLGNWEAVSNSLKTKTADECESHYTDYYFHGNIGRATLPKQRGHVCVDHTNTLLECRAAGLPLSVEEQLTVEEQRELGYMLLRGDFYREFDSEAEESICNVSLNYNDTDLDTAFKLCQVDMYNHRLQTRVYRKNLALEYRLLHQAASAGYKSLLQSRKKESRVDRLQREQMQKFARFLTKAEHDRLTVQLKRQQKLSMHIRTLIKLNAKGYTDLKGKLKMFASQMNGFLQGKKRRRKKQRYYYK